MAGDLFDDDAPLPEPELRHKRQPSRVQQRLLDTAESNAHGIEEIGFLHTVMAQTSMPYRSTDQRLWAHRNGNALLQIEAGYIEDPQTEAFVEVPLPWGAQPRLVLAHLNGEALRQETRHVEIENSLHAFARRVLGYAPNGRQMRRMRDQLYALSAATIRLSVRQGQRRVQVNDQIVKGLELWDGHEHQRRFWPAQIVLSHEYFENLQQFAVPLNYNHLAALKHSAMALDIYSWLANRLHRIRDPKGQFVSWAQLHGQFGHGYGRIDNFRQVFRRALIQVTSVYPEARVGDEIDAYGNPLGVRLERSKPPVLKRE